MGAYLFGGLKSLASTLQRVWPQVPTQVFQVAPFALMLLALLLVSSDLLDRLTALLPPRIGRPLRNALRAHRRQPWAQLLSKNSQPSPEEWEDDWRTRKMSSLPISALPLEPKARFF